MKTPVLFDYPFEHDGETVSGFEMRRPTVGDHMLVQKAASTDAEREIRLIANLAGVAPDVLNKVDLKDYGKLQAALASFLS